MSALRDWLSRSALGGSVRNVPLLELIRVRIKHPFGFCQVVVGYTESPNGSYSPFAKCWVCGYEAPQYEPSYADVRKHVAAYEKFRSEQNDAPKA